LSYYEILGLTKESSQEDIDRSYKKKALEHHPDRNPGDVDAAAKFLQIQEAYDTLKDPRKRKEYDMRLNGGGFNPFGNFNFDIFEHDNLDLRISVPFTLNDTIYGNQKTIKIQKKHPCNICDGIGSTNFSICNMCQGTGSMMAAPTPFFNFRTMCARCSGRGKLPHNKCSNCYGDRYVNGIEEEISYTIPKGLMDGMSLMLRGQGNIGKDGRVGNLILDCRMEHNSEYKIDGLNLLSNLKIKYSTLLFGGKIEINTPENETFEIDVPATTECLTKFTIKNKGMFDIKNLNKRGDIIISVVVDIPKNLKQDDELKQIFIKHGI
jgi:molecular chaperone DnaJ